MKYFIALTFIASNVLFAAEEESNGFFDFFKRCCPTRRIPEPEMVISKLEDEPDFSQQTLEFDLKKLEENIQLNVSCVGEQISSIVTQLERNFPSQNNSQETQKSLHDIRHCLNLMLYAYELVQIDQYNVEPYESLKRGIHYIRQMIPGIYKSVKQPVMISEFPQNLLEIVDSVVPLCHMAARRADVTFMQKVSNELESFNLLDKSHALTIQRVLYNLVYNAIEHTRMTKKPVVTVKPEKYEDNYAIFIVEDTGIGITPDTLGKLFKLHYRANDTRYRGSGIGLYSCKELVTLAGGEIGVASGGLNLGSTFWFTIPYVYKENVDRRTVRRKVNKDTMLVLMVDDCDFSVSALESLCIKVGIKNFHRARNGEKAVEMNAMYPYDLIFMDMHLGEGISGATAAYIIRNTLHEQLDEYEKYEPIILSTSADTLSQDSLKKMGLDDSCAKPISQNNFQKTLNKYFIWD